MSEPFLGEIKLFGLNFAVRSWAFTHGQLLPISQNTALFSLLGTTFGGDGRTSFALPDTRGRTVVGEGRGAGLTQRQLGLKSGVETTTLSVQNLPPHSHPHSHPVNGTNEIGNLRGPGTDLLAKAPVGGQSPYHNGPATQTMDPSMIGAPTNESTTGAANQSFNNMQPFIVLNYEIALQGIFPSRS